jgi:hypothetical protein
MNVSHRTGLLSSATIFSVSTRKLFNSLSVCHLGLSIGQFTVWRLLSEWTSKRAKKSPPQEGSHSSNCDFIQNMDEVHAEERIPSLFIVPNIQIHCLPLVSVVIVQPSLIYIGKYRIILQLVIWNTYFICVFSIVGIISWSVSMLNYSDCQ